MANKHITVSDLNDGQVVEVRLGPAPGNVIGMDLMEELSAEISRLSSDSPENMHVKLIIFTGEGDHFSYGASVEEHRPESVGAMLPRFHALIGQVLHCRIPTLARVSGLCLGGGFELALACSMIFCAEDAGLGVPEIQLGVFPPAASVLLPCKVGDSVACEIILSGQTYSADECGRLGIVNKVAAKESLEEMVSGFVEKHILPKSASSLKIACEVSRLPIREYYDGHIGAVEKIYLDTLMSTTDAVEGIASFLEKRSPRWVDK